MTIRFGALDGYSNDIDSADSMVSLTDETAEMFANAAEVADLAKKKAKTMACDCGGSCECHKASEAVQAKCMKCMGGKTA